jgi:NADH dehydrogenase
MNRDRHVVVVGAGFGGLTVAQELGGEAVRVTVIDRQNHHLFQPLLYQVAMAGLSPAEIAAPIRGVLAPHKNVKVLLGDVTSVDLAKKTVAVDGETLAYDALVLAVGARTSYFGHDEWATDAPGLKSLDDALEIRHRVLFAFERAERETDPAIRARLLTFVVIGGGPTGVELAGAVSELARYVLNDEFRSINPRDAKVVLLEAGPRILASFPERLSASAVEQLGELGVEVRTGTKVTGIDPYGVAWESAHEDDLPGLGKEARGRIEASTVVWGAGVQGTSLARSLGVPLDRQGRVIVDEHTRIPGADGAFAIGDMAHLEQDGKPLPGLSPVAMQQARHVAKILLRGPDGPLPKPFRYVDKGTMATIGRSRAIAYAAGVEMRGFLAWLAWLFIHLIYLIGFRSRAVVLFTWAWSYFAYDRGARLMTHPMKAIGARVIVPERDEHKPVSQRV